MNDPQHESATTAVSSFLRQLGRRIRLLPTPEDVRARDRRAPYGKGTGRPSYAVVQANRAANRRARAARRITRASR
jgi:hypothetical protein